MQPLGSILAVFVWRWLIRLGGPGLILLGIADNSVVPLTGSMDILTLWLAAAHRNLWPYYAGMATIGSVAGGYVTYALGRKGGKQAIQRRLKKQRADRIFDHFERVGFRTVTVSAILPPPFPMVPVLLAAGALQYPKRKFVGALALGRGVRYFLIAGIGSRYARPITAFFHRYYKDAVLILIGLAVLGAIFGLREYLRSRRNNSPRQPAISSSRAA
jgi:membrane protein YqaA with SNARE-associated domain